MTAQYCNCYVNFSVFVEKKKKILVCCHKNRFFVFIRIFKKKREDIILRYNYKGSEINFILYGIIS